MEAVIFEKEGANPLTGERVISTRRRIVSDMELPRGDPYGVWLERIVEEAQTM